MRKHAVIIVSIFILIVWAIAADSAELIVSPDGNDSSGNGTMQSPFRTIQHVLDNVAQSGDTITLRTGTYNEQIRVRHSSITIRSKYDEWAKISNPPNLDPYDSIITVLFDVESQGSKLQRVEVTGGFYGIAFFSQWDWDETPLDNDTTTSIIIEDCKIHDTGRDAIKLPAGSDDITIRRCEIYNSGVGYPPGTPDDEKNAEGIDVVNSDRILVQDCYIHDIATTGIYMKGGSMDGVIERTRIENCGGIGIAVGFDTSPEFFDLSINPDYYENIRGIVRNCFVSNTQYAGIALYGSKDVLVFNNTIVNTAKSAHSPIYFGLTYQDWDDIARRPANVNPVIKNNIVMQTELIDAPCVSIRYSEDLGGMSALKGSATINNNCYYRVSGSCIFEDNRPDSLLENATLAQWKTHIQGESQSVEIDPKSYGGCNLASGAPCICLNLSDDLALNIAVAYQGGRYGFKLNYTPIAADSAGLYWKIDVSTFKQLSDNTWISAADDLTLNVCAEYRGSTYELTLNYTPVLSDPNGIYWKADLSTFKQRI
ncbi:MAG: right-handed parallel beta-helix repeat-containing protein [Desulfamplus sp.]|nr:right-handed parallel beta-helix repeat-containing protein [Desulfamplus sp.]